MILAASFAGCATASRPPLPYLQNATALSELDSTGAGKIRHIIYIIQENRSFDNLFQGYPGADTVSSGKDSEVSPLRSSRCRSRRSTFSITRRQAMFTDCNGSGKLPGTSCRMNGFEKEIYGTLRPPRYRCTFTCRTKTPSRTSTWRTNGCWPTKCFNLSSTKVSLPISIPLPRRQPRPSISHLELLGLRRRRQRRRPDDREDRTLGKAIAPCFDYQTLGDELGDAGLSWRFTPAPTETRSNGDGGEWSGYQAVKHIRYGPE